MKKNLPIDVKITKIAYTVNNPGHAGKEDKMYIVTLKLALSDSAYNRTKQLNIVNKLSGEAQAYYKKDWERSDSIEASVKHIDLENGEICG
jgi:hypothetical protein